MSRTVASWRKAFLTVKIPYAEYRFLENIGRITSLIFKIRVRSPNKNSAHMHTFPLTFAIAEWRHPRRCSPMEITQSFFHPHNVVFGHWTTRCINSTYPISFCQGQRWNATRECHFISLLYRISNRDLTKSAIIFGCWLSISRWWGFYRHYAFVT